MKKYSFLLLFVLSLTFLQAQPYTLLNQEAGQYINDGDIITVSQNTFTTHVIVANNATVPIKATLEALNIINTDGSEMTFCFGFNGEGSCYLNMNTGTVYQSNPNGTTYLQPGTSSTSTDVDFTHNDSNNNFTTYPKDYVIKITIINANDDSEIGSTTFTYRYDPNAAAINHLNNSDLSINSLPGVLKIKTTDITSLQIFNLTGQRVLQRVLEKGAHSISTVDMPKGIYIVQAKSNGLKRYKKIIIR